MRRSLLTLALAATAWPAASQIPDLALDLDLESDWRRRGLSESAGAVSAAARLGLDPLPGLALSAEAMLLRGSPRHGGAEAGLTLAAFYSAGQGMIGVDLGLIGHAYAGAAGRLDYGELHAGLRASLGPARLGASASYAPPQPALGGDNLYLSLQGDLGLPGSPLTLRGHAGRSSGRVDDPLRARRLRPGGTAWDWSLGVDHVRGPLLIGLRYSAIGMAGPRPDASTDAPFTDPRHSGAALTARIGYRF